MMQARIPAEPLKSYYAESIIGAETKTQTAAEEILNFADLTAGRLAEIEAHLAAKLRPVLSDPSAANGVEEGLSRRPYPPLFEDLYILLISLNRSLDSINDTINRIEL
jgi:hypothetical protein